MFQPSTRCGLNGVGRCKISKVLLKYCKHSGLDKLVFGKRLNWTDFENKKKDTVTKKQGSRETESVNTVVLIYA